MTQPFYFPDGSSAYNAEDLIKLCERYPDDGTNYLVREDLEKWLAYIGSEEIAECAASARQTNMGDREKLNDFLNRCHALAMPKTNAKKIAEFTISETSAQKIVDAASAQKSAPSDIASAAKEAPKKETPVDIKISTPEPKLERKVTVAPSTTAKVASPETATPQVDNYNENDKLSFLQVIARFVARILS